MIVIPARFASTRLPGKPLADIGGKPLLQLVHDRARETHDPNIVVATDDERIRRVAEGFGARVVMTSATHRSGTERIGEVIETLGVPDDEVVVNLQGDEPLMPASLVREVGDILRQNGDAVMSTACHAITSAGDFQDPNVVKVVLDSRGNAIYFSRAPIPWPRDAGPSAPVTAYRHIGLYGYRAGFVARYLSWGPCALEQIESLEQLRVLWHGERIAVCVAKDAPALGVDTPQDLDRVRHLLAPNG